MDYIRIGEVVAIISIAWKEEANGLEYTPLYPFQQLQINGKAYHTKDGCRHKIKSNLS